MNPESLPPQSPPPPAGDNHEKGAFVLAVISLCFGALGAVWSFIGGACCGWAGWGWAFLGLVLAGVSLFLQRSKLGWWGLGVSAFAFVWVIIQTSLLAGTAAGGLGAAGGALSHPPPHQ